MAAKTGESKGILTILKEGFENLNHYSDYIVDLPYDFSLLDRFFPKKSWFSCILS